MTPQQPIDPTLRDEALDLIIRIQSDPANDDAIETARRWRSRSREHARAWDRAASLHSLAGSALRADSEASGRPLSRRAFVIGGSGALAAGLAGVSLLPGAITRLRADVTTATAEVRRLELPDHSVATLGPDTALTFVFDDLSRRIDLLAGMAFIEVAPYRAKALEVAAGGVVASTTDGAFDVIEDGDALTLMAARGRISIAGPEAAIPALTEGDWITIAPSAAVERGRREPSETAAWRSGVIVAEREKVEAVAARIARWMPGRVIVDPAVGARRISGVYNLENPLSALRAAVQPHGGRVRQATPWLTVISRI